MGREEGAWGEAKAAEFLKKKGCRILETGWSCRFGELDIIACDRHYLMFVEVKTRKNASFASAMEFVDARKQQRLWKTASLYLSCHPTELQPRFDVIEVYAPQGTATRRPVINHLENAFEL